MNSADDVGSAVPSMGRSEAKEGKKFSDIDPALLDPHGTMNHPNHFPGLDGLPYRGYNVPHLKERDPEAKRPKEAAKAHVDILDMSDEKERERYRDITQVVVNGYGAISFEDRQYDPEKKTWLVFVRWYELYCTTHKKV